ncbi:MAG: hypothetical protein U5K36_11220 [Roseovarius sp.]|nr:hypothetical protein [Roseovarius sp.]
MTDEIAQPPQRIIHEQIVAPRLERPDLAQHGRGVPPRPPRQRPDRRAAFDMREIMNRGLGHPGRHLRHGGFGQKLLWHRAVPRFSACGPAQAAGQVVHRLIHMVRSTSGVQ